MLLIYKKVLLQWLCLVAKSNDYNGFVGVNVSTIIQCLKKTSKFISLC